MSLTDDELEQLEQAFTQGAMSALEEFFEGRDLGGGDGEFPTDVRDEFESIARELRFPGRLLNDVDPQDDEGRYHSTDHWGIDFSVKRPCYIRSAVVDAETTGTFTAVLNKYDSEDRDEFEVVDQVEVDVDESEEPVRVGLGLEVPDEGVYQLTRDGDFPLWRGEYDGWNDYHKDYLKVITGGKPDAMRDGGFSDEDFWYYFYSIECTASPDHEFEG